MQIDYPLILQKNMLNVFKEVLKEIETNGLKEGHHLYITFETNNNEVKIPNWLAKKFPTKMMIVIRIKRRTSLFLGLFIPNTIMIV